MAITPDTQLRIIKSPLTLSNKHQLTFANKEAQEQYFLSLPFIEIDDISYQRKDNIIRFDAHIDDIIEYNYCMYKNKNYSDKWFYAFIVNMEYINDRTTNIKIVTDVFQTWQFDIIFKQSFIEREMLSVNDDVPGANLIPENFEIGEPIINATASIDDLEPFCIVAYSGESFPLDPDDPQSITINGEGGQYNGIATSISFIVTDMYSLKPFISQINNLGYGESIVSIFTVPKIAIKSIIPSVIPSYFVYPLVPGFKQPIITKTLNARPSSIDGYTPRNKKLLQYPYLYLGFNPQNGSEKIYRYENFLNATPSFDLFSEINPSPVIEVIPKNYRGDGSFSINDASVITGYPTLGSKNDIYNSWLAKNSEVINLQMKQGEFNMNYGAVSSGASMIGDMLGIALDPENAGTHFSSLINSASTLIGKGKNYEYDVAEKMSQIEAQKLLPDQVSLSSSNATLLGYDKMEENIFTRYSIKKQFAERIDNYFDMYGYLTNEVKLPNLNNRPYWNYVKTVGANILGTNNLVNIPQQDLETIKNMFNQGVTLWHNAEYFLDYSQNNR